MMLMPITVVLFHFNTIFAVLFNFTLLQSFDKDFPLFNHVPERSLSDGPVLFSTPGYGVI